MFLWGKFPPRSGLLGLRPAVSFATPSWVRPGTDTCKPHASVGRTRGHLHKKDKKSRGHCERSEAISFRPAFYLIGCEEKQDSILFDRRKWSFLPENL
jgi:hypothetical protein